MIEIIGAYNRAICYTDALEETAREQLKAVCDLPTFADEKIRVMPDVHAGRGCTIGTTMTIADRVVPAMVGVDIGCGMYTVELGAQKPDLRLLDEASHRIPSGTSVWEGRVERFDLTALRCYRALKDSKRLERSLGTLGGGNHFIELDVDEEGDHYLVIHSGSRNLGKQVAEYYQQIALDLNMGKEEYFRRRNEIIESYKAAGRRSEIQGELRKLEKEWQTVSPTLPRDLCHLYGAFMEDYLHDVAVCQNFATRNREKMAELLLEWNGLEAGDAFHTVHNYINVEERILRKGAVSARAGERLLIPINMRDGSLLCVGKGNADWNFSAPHGAGRLMSRRTALEQLTMAEYAEAMQGIYSTCVLPETLDESPMAYKSIDDILKHLSPTAEVVGRLKPIYNFKAAE
ncbi:MAG: RtcB family protein [Ruminococcaceae bacterium]|nr:RtcB family protein [Oscillospiraceae bacterium]